ncbi:MAG: tetratricopeptide repeat protein [Thermoleophilia bacterium]
MLLDRNRAKVWQKWVFAFMALIMVGFIVMIPLSGQIGCGGATTASEAIADDIAKYEAAVAANPNDVSALRGLGDSYLASAAQLESGSDAQRTEWFKAISYYEKAVAVLAEQKGADAKEERVDVLEQIVDTYLALGEYQDAADVYVRITALTPKDAQAYFNWATMADRAGDTSTALLAFKKFLELDPKSPYAADVETWIEENTPKASASPSAEN